MLKQRFRSNDVVRLTVIAINFFHTSMKDTMIVLGLRFECMLASNAENSVHLSFLHFLSSSVSR